MADKKAARIATKVVAAIFGGIITGLVIIGGFVWLCVNVSWFGMYCAGPLLITALVGGVWNIIYFAESTPESRRNGR